MTKTKNQIAYILVGLPASGKTTFANYFAKNAQEIVKIISRDIIREKYNLPYSEENEKKTKNIEKELITKNLNEGNNIIIDDTNLKKKTIFNLIDIIRKVDAKFHIKIFIINTNLETCIKRDANRKKSVGETVLRRMGKNKIIEDNNFFIGLAVNLQLHVTNLTLKEHSFE